MEMREWDHLIFGRKMFQAEGTASAKALRLGEWGGVEEGEFVWDVGKDSGIYSGEGKLLEYSRGVAVNVFLQGCLEIS